MSVVRGDDSPEGIAVAGAIDAFLTESVVSTTESVVQANNAAVRAFGVAGVTLELIETRGYGPYDRKSNTAATGTSIR